MGDGEAVIGGASGSNDPRSTCTSMPKPDKSHIAGLSLPLDSLIPPEEPEKHGQKRSHRGSVGQSKKSKWTKRDWCWAGWNWGANEAYQGYYGAGARDGTTAQSHVQQAASASTVAAAIPGPAMPKPRPYNRAYTIPAAAIDAKAATMGATSKSSMPARASGLPAVGTPVAATPSAPLQCPDPRPVGQSPHWSIPAPLMPHTPITPGPPSRVLQADERLLRGDQHRLDGQADSHRRVARQDQAPDSPADPQPRETMAPPPTPPPMPRSAESSGGASGVPCALDGCVRPPMAGRATAPEMPRPVPDPPAAPAIPVPAVPNVRGSPVQLLRPTIWDLTHSQVCHYRLQRGAQLERLLRNLTQLLDG